MKYYAVIDTNVIVSALLKENSIPWQILDLVVNQDIIPVYNDDIIKEYQEVLTRNKFGFSLTKVAMTLSLIRDYGIKLTRAEIIEQFTDKKDIIFYQIVMTATQNFDNSYLITGNFKHFPKKKFIVTPAEMIEIISQNTK